MAFILSHEIDGLVQEIKNNAWVTVYNDCWVTSEAICQWFSRVMKSRVKIIGKSHREWPKKLLFTVTNVLFYFLHAILCPGSHNSAKNHHRSLISQLSPRTAFSDFTLWRHHCWSVTSREREILALWRHICRLSLHAQIGAKAIFTSEKQPWISTSHHPVFTAKRVRKT